MSPGQYLEAGILALFFNTNDRPQGAAAERYGKATPPRPQCDGDSDNPNAHDVGQCDDGHERSY